MSQGDAGNGEPRVVDYDSPDYSAPDPARNRAGTDQVDVARAFRGEVGDIGEYRRQNGEWVTVARPAEGGWTYDRPRWFRFGEGSRHFRIRNMNVTSPEFTMHSHPRGSTIGPSLPDRGGSLASGAMGVVINGNGSMTFYQFTPQGHTLGPVTFR